MRNNRKEELLGIAYHKFTTKGYENTSVDEIISEAKIAKGTYYYYFTSKEEMLNDVIENMIKKQVESANKILKQKIPIEQKIAGILASFKLRGNEINIVKTLNREENIKMHTKINKKIIESAIPILKDVVLEGISNGVFQCNNVEERIKIVLILSNELFDDQNFTERDIEVFIDTVEKILGAKTGTMEFIKQLIGGYNEGNN